MLKKYSGCTRLTLFILVISAAYLFCTSLDEITELALESFASERLNAAVHIDNVNLDFIKAQATLNHVSIGNPPGFSGDYSIKLEQVAVSLDSLSIGERQIVISKIEVSNPEIIYEFSNSGNNIERLIEHASTNSVSDKNRNDSNHERVVDIDNLVIHAGEIRVKHQVLRGQSFDLELPYMDLQGLRRGKKAASSESLSEEILANIKTEIGVAIASASIRTGLQSSATK